MTLKEELLKETTNPIFKLGKKASKVLEALETFKKTGRIPEALVEGFTQHGNWIGVYGAAEIEMHNSILQGTILPKERRIKTDEDGYTHLLTSYRNIDKGQKIDLPYKSIGGILSAPFCSSLSAKNLTHVNGKMELEKATKVDLPKLKIVKGPVSLPRLKEANFPNLKQVLGILNIYRSTKLNAPKLQEVKHARLETLSVKNKETIIKNLSTKSLKSIKESTYSQTERTIINKELGRRKVLDIIAKRGETNEITI
jgi:hypothetical protein